MDGGGRLPSRQHAGDGDGDDYGYGGDGGNDDDDNDDDSGDAGYSEGGGDGVWARLIAARR